MRKIGESIKEERLKFKRGLQKKFLENIKKKSGLSWVQLSKNLGLCKNTVSFYWKNELSTIPKSFAEKLITKYPFEKWEIIQSKWVGQILGKNWGQELSAQLNKKVIRIPPKSEELAEIFGIILGDGHLTKKTLIVTGNSYEIEHYIYLRKKSNVYSI